MLVVKTWVTFSTVFTARRVCIARTMPWQYVCSSVCPSHGGIESKRLYMSSKSSGSSTIPVFAYQTRCQYSDWDPLTGASNVRGYDKNHNFRPISGFISEMMQDRGIVTMEDDRKPHPNVQYKFSALTAAYDSDVVRVRIFCINLCRSVLF